MTYTVSGGALNSTQSNPPRIVITPICLKCDTLPLQRHTVELVQII